MSVADRLELTDLVSRLGACLDEHRFTDIHALLAEEVAISTPGGTATGADAVVAQASRNHDEYRTHQHAITNVLIDLAGDEATIRANVLSVWVRAGASPEFGLGGVYRFAARRTAGGWRLCRIEITPVWRTAA